MASKRSIAIRIEAALNALEQSTVRLSERLKIDAPYLRATNRDPDVVLAEKLEAIGLWVEALEGKLEPQPAQVNSLDRLLSEDAPEAPARRGPGGGPVRAKAAA